MGKKKKQVKTVIPWVEKYRPKKLKFLIGQDHIIPKIEAHIRDGSPLNILLKGEEGLGKTTIAGIAAAKLSNFCNSNILEVNASNLGRQEYLNEFIIPFCDNTPLEGGKIVIILDEFDYSSAAMQGSMRRVMEDACATGDVVFILTCNFERKIIKPIRSRCAMFTLKRPSENDLLERGKFILKEERVNFEEEDLYRIAVEAEFKPRNFIMNLQRDSIDGVLDVTKSINIETELGLMLRCLLKSDYRNLDEGITRYYDVKNKLCSDDREIIRKIHAMLVKQVVSNAKKEISDGKEELRGRLLKILMEIDVKLSEREVTADIQMVGMLVLMYLTATPFVQSERAMKQKKIDLEPASA